MIRVHDNYTLDNIRQLQIGNIILKSVGVSPFIFCDINCQISLLRLIKLSKTFSLKVFPAWEAYQRPQRTNLAAPLGSPSTVDASDALSALAASILNVKYWRTLQRKSHLSIPFLGIVRPQSRFPHSCVYERFSIFPYFTYFLQQNRQTDPRNI